MLRNLTKMMHNRYGQILISVILGLGLASLLRRSCDDANCLRFKAPPPDLVSKNVYKHGGSCYKFTHASATCSPTKRIVDIDAAAANPAGVRQGVL